MISEFRFAYPFVFLLVLIPAFIYLRPALRQWALRPAVMTYSDTRLFKGLGLSWRVRLRHLPDALRVLVWLLLIVALARPQTGQAQEVIRGQGIDIVLAIDISTSMAALDFRPLNRLEAVKTVIGDFISGREFDRIGLVVFARNAYHLAPLTLDYAVLLQLINEIQLVSELSAPEGRRLDGTALGLGLASSANMLRSSESPSKVIILLTDGDNNAGLDPIEAAAAVAALDIRIYTVGMGRPGLVNIPDRQGNILTIESDLNEEMLQRIADIGDGLYFRAEDSAGLQRIYRQIDSLERTNVERRIFIRWQDQVAGLLTAALLLLITERVLRHTLFQVIP